MTRVLVACLFAVALVGPTVAEAQFTWRPPGELEAPGGTSTRPGAGRVDDRVYAPGMRFPIESAPAYANSQIYGHGGYMGPGGGECDAGNFAYPWYDNYCEERSWDMPMCPSGNGHQGQDIRPASCRDDYYWAVAAADGTITNIGSYSVYVTADDGRRYDYLHMRSVAVSVGQRVSRGQRLGKVSDNFGGTATTTHLHFNIRMNVSGYGNVYAPTYMSLVRSYEELVGPPAWSASWVDQSFPLASRPFELYPGQEVEGHIELRNTGGETWEPGATFLGTTEPRDAASPLAAPSWISDHRAATVDRTVPPGETGRFVFTVRAPDTLGEYPQFFNLVQEGVAWFSDSGVPPDDQLQVKVTVVAAPDGDGDGHDASVDCDDADPAVHPGASDPCGDGVDQDCSGDDAVCREDGGPSGVDAGGTVPDGGSVPDRRDGATGPGAADDRMVTGGCSTAGGGFPAAWPLLVTVLAVLRRRR